MTIFDAKNQTFDGFQTSKNGKSSFSVPGKVASPRVGARPTMVTAGIVIHSMKIWQTRWTIKHGRFLASNLGILASNKGGECRFKHGEFGFLTSNIGKIVKPESKMRRMEIYSKNHNILNTCDTIYAIMCMGFCRDHRFLPCGQCRKLAIGNWEWSWKNPVGALPMHIAVRTPQMGFQDRCMQGQRCPLLATSARTWIHVSNRYNLLADWCW